MKIKTSDLIGPALDWAVAVCEGWVLRLPLVGSVRKPWFERTDKTGIFRRETWELLYSTNWSQGGPIIEREGISVSGVWIAQDDAPDYWTGFIEHVSWGGPTPLIAAMRCFVASKLGDEVDVPEKLV